MFPIYLETVKNLTKDDTEIKNLKIYIFLNCFMIYYMCFIVFFKKYVVLRNVKIRNIIRIFLFEMSTLILLLKMLYLQFLKAKITA